MVALSAGRLAAEESPLHQPPQANSASSTSRRRHHLGSGTTFTDIRTHAVIASDFPLLVQAASWTGSIANQNRGTLGGNIVNALTRRRLAPRPARLRRHPHPRLRRGPRTLPYRDFHLGYKKTALAPDELLYTITLPRRFAGYRSYIRKVGTRNAQAISKVALACLALRRRTTSSPTSASAPPASAKPPPAAPPPSRPSSTSPSLPPPSPPPAPRSPPKPAPSTTSAPPPNTAPPSPPTSSKNSSAACSSLQPNNSRARSRSSDPYPRPAPRPQVRPLSAPAQQVSRAPDRRAAPSARANCERWKVSRNTTLAPRTPTPSTSLDAISARRCSAVTAG